jgi:hypothetical protein
MNETRPFVGLGHQGYLLPTQLFNFQYESRVEVRRLLTLHRAKTEFLIYQQTDNYPRAQGTLGLWRRCK